MFQPDYHPDIVPFLEYLRLVKRRSPHTILSYGTDLQLFFTYLARAYDGLTDPKEVTGPMIASWLVGMEGRKRKSQKTEKASPATIKRRLSAIQSFYKYRRKAGLQTDSPAVTVKAPKSGRRLPVFVEPAQMDTLLRHVEFPDTHNGYMERLVIHLLYHTGMRRSELAGLKISQVDAARKQIRVMGKGSKERLIPVSDEMLQMMELSRSREFVVSDEKGKRLSDKKIYEIVKKYLSLVTTIEKKSPHVLRHTFATHLANNGADLNAVKELLGHSSLAATQVYTHNNIEKLREAYRKAHPKGG